MAEDREPGRWSDAVREAFLRGLAVHGSVRRACREVGLSVPGAYHLRHRDAGFAAGWDAALARAGEARAALATAQGARAQRKDGMFGTYRRRHDGWTEARTRAFLRALAETGSVRDGCARARISSTSAYRMRKRDAKFATAWQRALAKARPTLEQAAFERAVEGWDEVVYRGGVEYSRKRRFSEGLLRLLLQREDARAAAANGSGRSPEELEEAARDAARLAGGYFARVPSEQDTNATLTKLLAGLRKTMDQDVRDQWDRDAAEYARAKAGKAQAAAAAAAAQAGKEGAAGAPVVIESAPPSIRRLD
jgi:molybdenum-dependent DNA-binding transcriptional regulator ModE